MKDLSDQQLLREYTTGQSEMAFSELVRRHVDLVFSAALRMTREEQSARDATQGAFVALAQNASRLAQHPVLSGWLHCTVRNLAAKSIRTEVRRKNREHEAFAMNELLAAEAAPNWDDIAPQLDEALGELNESDRDALLLRYFEKKSAREMAGPLGISEEAAQKRVTRALERLREVLARRGVTAGVGGLAAVITANAVQAAPAGFAATISTAAVLGAGALSATTAVTTTKVIAMTTLQKTLAVTVAALLAGVGIYEGRQAASLRKENEALRQRQGTLTEQVAALQEERDAAAQRLRVVSTELAGLKNQPTEVHKLRGQVGVLREEKEAMASKSALSKITADPETRKLMRDQQKMGMSAIYGDLAKQLKLTEEQTGQFNDLMADQVMENIDIITQALHDKKSRDEIDQLFTIQENALNSRIESLLGTEGLAQYKEYTRNLLSTVTASQFESQLNGDKETKAAKKLELTRAMQEESAFVLAKSGLPPAYQTVPMLNFRNIASEEQGEFSLQLMDQIYAGVATRAITFLTEEELKKLAEFRTKAQDNNRMMLTINRKMMAPIAQ